MSDASFIRLFTHEVARLLAALESETGAVRERVITDAVQAAMFLDEPDASRAHHILGRLEAGQSEAADELAALTRELARREGDAAEPPPASGRIFDTEETRTLRSFFRDEVHEHLERVIGDLAELGPEGPDRHGFDELLRLTHLLKGSAGTVGLPVFADAAHRLEEALARSRGGTLPWSLELGERVVEIIDALLAYVDAVESPAARRAATAELELRAAALDRLSGGELTAAPGPAAPESGRFSAEAAASVVVAEPGDHRRRPTTHVLRVDPRRIDRLMDGVGELTFDRTRIERRVGEIELQSEGLARLGGALRRAIAALAASPDAAAAAAELSAIETDLCAQIAAVRDSAAALIDDAQTLRRTTADLQRGLTGIRMQSAAALFERLAPRVRAMARAEGKRVKLQLQGGDTEFDRAVAEQVSDALVQLLRNAVAHGIEPADQRRQAGKPELGVITLAARGEGESVAIDVVDDGAGLDTPALRQRLIELGAWSRERAETESDDEVLRAVFFSNVSSKPSAGLLAGRGVGLGAVRETVARLGGEIRLSSSPGQGTTFTVLLPLTTAVASALLFKVAGNVYAVPNVNVVETAMIETSGPAIPTHLRIRSDPVPLILLHALLGAEIPGDARTVPAVVIEYLGRRLAFTCDKIVGPREIVVKSLGPLLSSMSLYAGGTVSGSGKVQLILDPATLVRLAFPSIEIDQSVKADRHLPGATPTPRERGPRVLIVDDSLTVRETLSRALERAGFAVDSAADGAEAWDRLVSSRYDALVTDLEMPALDGFELIERIRAGAAADLPIVVITSRATDTNRARAAALGVKDLLAKPVSPRRLAKILGE